MYYSFRGILSAMLILVQSVLLHAAAVLHINDDTLRASILIGPGQSVYLHGEIRIEDSVAITVLSGGRLMIDSAQITALHASWSGLRTCDDDTSLASPGLSLVNVQLSGADSVLRSRGRLKAGLHAVELSECGVLVDWRGPAAGKPIKCEWLSWREGKTGYEVMGTLRGVPGIQITASAFEGLDGQLGWSIRDAGLLIDDSLARNTMAGWSLAVDMSSIYGVMPAKVRIEGTDFEGPRAIRLFGLSLLQIRDNSFSMHPRPALGDTLYAIYMETVSDVLLERNQILGQGRGFGIVIVNCGARPNLVRSNNIRHTRAAVVVINGNGGRRFGLAMLCNDLRNNQQSVWLYSPDEVGSILGWQGHCPGFPASNLFDRPWVLDGLARPVNYWEVSGRLEDSLTTALRFQDCADSNDTGCPVWNHLSAEVQLQRLRSHELLLDNGDTEGLLTLVRNPATPRGIMEFALSEASPYLSDTVLIVLLDRIPEVVPAFLEFILLSNSPVSNRVLEFASEVLPASDFELLMTAQEGLSARQFLESQLALWELQWSEMLSHSWYDLFEQSDSSRFQLFCDSRPELCTAFQISQSLIDVVSDASAFLGWLASNCDPGGCELLAPAALLLLENLAEGNSWQSALATNVLRQWLERWELREELPALIAELGVKELSTEVDSSVKHRGPRVMHCPEVNQPCKICLDPSGRAYHLFPDSAECADRLFQVQRMGWICKPCR